MTAASREQVDHLADDPDLPARTGALGRTKQTADHRVEPRRGRAGALEEACERPLRIGRRQQPLVLERASVPAEALERRLDRAPVGLGDNGDGLIALLEARGEVRRSPACELVLVAVDLNGMHAGSPTRANPRRSVAHRGAW